MIESPRRAAAALALSAAALGYVGCTGGGSPDEEVERRPPAETPTATTRGEGRPPAAVLFITGQQIGRLEPCGCTEGQTGGLGRRAHLLAEHREGGVPVVPLDLGGLIEDPGQSRGGRAQVEVKLGVALEALDRLDYDALALAPDDLRLGVFPYLDRVDAVDDAPPIVATNVTFDGSIAESFRPAARIEAGRLTVGVLAVVDPGAIDALANPDVDAMLTEIRDPAEAVRDALPDLVADTDAQVLLVQGPPGLARDLAEGFDAFEVVVATSEADVPPPSETFHGGSTRLVSVGRKGQHVGLVELFEGGADPRYRRVRLGPDYERVEPITSLLEEDYLRLLGEADVLADYPRRDHPSGARFIGAEACKACHPNTFETWANSKHHHAYEAIVSGPRGNRTMDAECVHCHTTGHGFTTGFLNADATPYLKAQQCENCHGPGSLHAAAPGDPEYLDQVALTVEYAREELCIRCHDSENSPHFDFAEYYPQVEHKGRDTYDDPEVHRGIDVEALIGPAADADAAE